MVRRILSHPTAADILAAHERRIRGLGDAATHQLITSSVSTGLTATAILYTALAADPEPLTKAALAIAAACVTIFQKAFSGCGSTCVGATKVVDQLEPYLKQNLANYRAGQTTQAQALQVFDAIWQDVVNGCSDPALGDAGKRCISERQRGGSAAWCPTGTGCDWFILYRDPIANDPNAPPVSLGQSLVSAVLPGVQLPAAAAELLPLALLALLVIAL